VKVFHFLFDTVYPLGSLDPSRCMEDTPRCRLVMYNQWISYCAPSGKYYAKVKRVYGHLFRVA